MNIAKSKKWWRRFPSFLVCDVVPKDVRMVLLWLLLLLVWWWTSMSKEETQDNNYLLFTTSLLHLLEVIYFFPTFFCRSRRSKTQQKVAKSSKKKQKVAKCSKVQHYAGRSVTEKVSRTSVDVLASISFEAFKKQQKVEKSR